MLLWDCKLKPLIGQLKKKKKQKTLKFFFIPFKPAYLCLKIYPKEIIRNRHKDLSTVFFTVLFITQK